MNRFSISLIAAFFLAIAVVESYHSGPHFTSNEELDEEQVTKWDDDMYCTNEHYNLTLDITCDMLKDNNYTFGDKVRCIEGNLHIRRAYWLGRHRGTKELVVGFCKFCDSFYYKKPGRFIPLNPENQCLTNRGNQLCSCCLNGTSAVVNSKKFACMQCQSVQVWGYFIIDIVGLFLLSLFIFFFNFFPASGATNALVFFGQIVVTAARIDCMGNIPMENQFKDMFHHQMNFAFEFFYGIWNLDFTHPAGKFCFAQTFTNVQVLAIGYLVALMPLFPVIFLILIVNFLDKIQNVVGRTCYKVFGVGCVSIISCNCLGLHMFPWLQRTIRFDKWQSIKTLVASYFLLAYTKFAMTTFYLMAPVSLYNSAGDEVEKVLYYQGNLRYLNSYHWGYFILSLFFLITYVLGFPLFLLVLRYKPITKSQVSGYVDQNQESKKNCLKRTLTYLDLFIDQSILKPYQRDLKWGKHKSSPCVGFKFWRFSFGIHDYRWYAGWYFLLRFALFAGNLFAMDFLIMLLFNEVMCTFALIVSLVAQPYKRNIHNRVDSFILILMSVLNMSVFFQYYLTYTGQPLNPSTYVLQYLFVFLPAIMMVVYFIGRLFLNCRNHRGQVQSDNLEFSVTSLDTVPGDVEPSNHTDNRIGTAASYGTMQIPPNTLDKDDLKHKKISKLKSYIKQHLCNCERARE